jgi:hypothetical protein
MYSLSSSGGRPIVMRVRIVVKSAYYSFVVSIRPSIFASVHLSVCPHVSAQLPLGAFPLNFMWAAYTKNFRETPNFIGIRHLKWRPKYMLLLPAKLNRLKSALFEWKLNMQLGYSRRYACYANAPQCYAIRTLSFHCKNKLVHRFSHWTNRVELIFEKQYGLI